MPAETHLNLFPMFKVMVPAGVSAVVDIKLEVPGTYILVDHSLSRLQKGAAGFL